MTVARKSIGERLAQLEAQRKTLQIRLSKQERAIDTRRKVLIGTLVLHRLEHDRDVQIGGGLAAWLRSELPKFLTRHGDRDLFDDLLKPQANEPSLGNVGNIGNRSAAS
ncbi:mobilization protein [Rhizobium sophorae]|uniref:Mobilization protein n=1 Tax=Rhizobium sophorae TaxID=1535242 RepID=A0A7Y3S276_9HYPH|nr:mobilization protein [Rhizobium sophorae]NNU35673.1 mobilization protein [Rhizobium sophorae]